MIIFWLWTRSQWLSLTIWLISRLYIFGGELMVALISHILPFHCNLSNGCMSDCWKLTPGPSSQHRTSSNVRCTHTHTKRPMWFHKRFPMLISSTEIRLISVSHPYPESMCSFKPRNWGDEKHVRSYPVQSNQYHFLVHASTALCCHMIFIYFHPTKNCNWFGLMQILWLKALRIHCNASSIMSFLILLALATQRAILDIVARHGITSLLNTNGSRTVSLLVSCFRVIPLFSTCGLEWLCLILCLSNQARQFSLSNPVWNTFMSELLEVQRKFLKLHDPLMHHCIMLWHGFSALSDNHTAFIKPKGCWGLGKSAVYTALICTHTHMCTIHINLQHVYCILLYGLHATDLPLPGEHHSRTFLLLFLAVCCSPCVGETL